MKQGLKLVRGDERRLARGRLAEIGDQADERTVLGAIHNGLAPELGHPRTVALGGAREEVHVEEGHVASLLILHVVNLHIRVVDRDVAALLEAQAVELACESEDCVNAVVQAEVRLELGIADGVSLVFELLGPVAEIPALEFTLEAVGSCIVLNGLHLFPGFRQGSLKQVLKEAVHLAWGLEHPLFQGVVGVGLVAEKICNLEPQGSYFLHQLSIVSLLFESAAVVGQVHLLAELPVVAETHERTVGRVGEIEGPTLLTGLLGSLLSEFLEIVRHPGEFGLVGDVELVGIGGGKHIASETDGGKGELFAELGVLLPVLALQVGSAPCETLVGLLQQGHLVLCKAETLLPLPHALHSGEEFLVEGNIHLVIIQKRGYLFGNLLESLIRIGLKQIEEDGADLVEGFAAPLHGFDGVFEIRLRAVCHYRVDFSLGLGYSLLEGGHVVLRLDFVELWGSVGEC